MLNGLGRAGCWAPLLLGGALLACLGRGLYAIPAPADAAPSVADPGPAPERAETSAVPVPRPSSNVVPAPDSSPGAEPPGPDPFASAEACEARASSRSVRREGGTARLVTWNVRWFPDGKAGKPRAGNEFGTDLEWLACALGSLNVDVAALQELKSGSRSERASNRLLALLDRRTGGRWRLVRDPCQGAGTQQVAVLYDERRVSLESSRVLPSLNAHGKACAGRLRPGLAAYFRFPGGLDFHVVSVHLKSGTDRRSFELRRRALAGLDRALSELQAAHDDADVVVAGDLNTMGCDECAPAVLAEQELALLDRDLATRPRPLARIQSDLGCSGYNEGRPTLLDHFLVSPGTAELGLNAQVRAAGYCGSAVCSRLRARGMPLAHRHLSDHCPLVLELHDVDRD